MYFLFLTVLSVDENYKLRLFKILINIFVRIIPMTWRIWGIFNNMSDMFTSAVVNVGNLVSIFS